MNKLYVLDVKGKLTTSFLSEMQQASLYELVLINDECIFEQILDTCDKNNTSFYVFSGDNRYREYQIQKEEEKGLKCESLVHVTNKNYLRAMIQKSFLAEKTIVGDFSRIEDSILSKFCKIERDNLVRDSVLGDYSYTGEFTRIFDSFIGKYVSIAWNVSIGPHEHGYTRMSTHSFIHENYNRKYNLLENAIINDIEQKKQTIIGNDVWIGCHAIIKRGVIIGDGAVIGSGSIVTKDVPPYAIVVGSPARILKYRFSKEIIEALLDLQWWNWGEDKIRRNEKIFVKQTLTIEDLKNII